MSVVAEYATFYLKFPTAATNNLRAKRLSAPVPRLHRRACAFARTHAHLWRLRVRRKREIWRRRPRASPRQSTGMWAVASSATCTSPRRTRFCCWTLLRRRRPNSQGARRARVPAGEGEGVLERRRRRTKARTVAALPGRRRCRPAWRPAHRT